MAESEDPGLREQARGWKCNQFAITDHDGNTAALLRKVADAIDQLGPIDILDIAYHPPADPSQKEITVAVYFSFLD